MISWFVQDRRGLRLYCPKSDGHSRRRYGFSREYGTPWRGARQKVEELTEAWTRALAME